MTCPKMNTNILRIFVKVCTIQGKGYTFPILFFQKILSNKFCLMSKNIKFSVTDKTKNSKKPYIFNSLFHGNDVQKVNNNTNVIAGILLTLLGNFMNISYRVGGLDFLKHFSPIYSYALYIETLGSPLNVNRTTLFDWTMETYGE